MHTLEAQIRHMNDGFSAHVERHAELVGAHFDAAGAAMEFVRERSMISIGERLPLPPALLPRRIQPVVERLHAMFRHALEQLFTHRLSGSWSHLIEELRLSDDVVRYMSVNRPPRWVAICRPDVVLHGDHLTMVEPNSGSSCGAMPDADVIGRIYAEAPVIGEWLRAHGARRVDAVGVLAGYLRGRLVEAGVGPQGLVVVTELRRELDDPTFYHCDLLADELRRHDVNATVAAVEDLDVDPRCVTLDGRKCGLVYRMWGEQPDPTGQYPVLAPLLAAARQGAVVLVDELTDQIAGNKTVLALLSEEIDAGRLATGPDHPLRAFVPWTRRLEAGPATVDGATVDLLPWCEANRDDLVVKPGAGFHGRGVTLGCEVSAAAWHEILDAALRSPEPWLVQRLVRSAPCRVSCSRDGRLVSADTYVDYGYYAVDGVVPAVIRRTAPFMTPATRRVKRAGIGPVFFV